eukprot:CAMPEP_0180574148 /NCGR_PEP_ID=MMETSP1037_2-20121125/10169_1 /TAXON_ID=632150 /ORGANISM="Azadinium spinosum, Strain 3D9" /LENGTH=193 /DNA_ID=CAMNT_0022591655 /DNA_START=82 /DNA_END=659 /DNA_ORIENTATION=+
MSDNMPKLANELSRACLSTRTGGDSSLSIASKSSKASGVGPFPRKRAPWSQSSASGKNLGSAVEKLPPQVEFLCSIMDGMWECHQLDSVIPNWEQAQRAPVSDEQPSKNQPPSQGISSEDYSLPVVRAPVATQSRPVGRAGGHTMVKELRAAIAAFSVQPPSHAGCAGSGRERNSTSGADRFCDAPQVLGAAG